MELKLDTVTGDCFIKDYGSFMWYYKVLDRKSNKILKVCPGIPEISITNTILLDRESVIQQIDKSVFDIELSITKTRLGI